MRLIIKICLAVMLKAQDSDDRFSQSVAFLRISIPYLSPEVYETHDTEIVQGRRTNR